MGCLIVADWICTKISALLMAFIVTLSKVMKKAKDSSKKCVFIYANDLLGDTMIKLPFFFSLRNEFPRYTQGHALLLPALEAAGSADR